MHKVLLLVFVGFFLVSCKNNKTVVAEKPENDPVEVPVVDKSEDAAPPREAAQPDTYRVVISLISMGEGTDPQGPAKVENLLKSWERRYGEKVAYTVQPWGREGESDYNFTLRGMSPANQEEFVKQLQSALKDEKLILVTENKHNRFKR